MCSAFSLPIVGVCREHDALHFAQARLSPATVGQHAGMAALDTPQSYFDDVVTEILFRNNFLEIRGFILESRNQISSRSC